MTASCDSARNNIVNTQRGQLLSPQLTYKEYQLNG